MLADFWPAVAELLSLGGSNAHVMMSPPKIRRSWLILACVILYLGLWWLTQSVGAPEVRGGVINGFPKGFTDITYTGGRGVSPPLYVCRAVAWAPFLVRVHYACDSGPLAGVGGHRLYVWFFGSSFRLLEYDHRVA